MISHPRKSSVSEIRLEVARQIHRANCSLGIKTCCLCVFDTLRPLFQRFLDVSLCRLVLDRFVFCTQPPSDTKTCQGIQKNLRFQPVKVSVEVISRSIATPASRFEQKNCRKMQFYTPEFPTYRWAGSNLPKGGSVSWNPLEPQNWCLGTLLGALGATKLIQTWWETEIFWWKTRQNSGKVSSWKRLLHKRNYKTGAWEPFGSYKTDLNMVRNRNCLVEN